MYNKQTHTWVVEGDNVEKKKKEQKRGKGGQVLIFFHIFGRSEAV